MWPCAVATTRLVEARGTPVTLTELFGLAEVPATSVVPAVWKAAVPSTVRAVPTPE